VAILNPELIKNVAKDIKAEIGEFSKAVGSAAVIKAIIAAVPRIIHKVEAISAELKSNGVKLESVDKKQLAMEIFFALLPLPIWAPRFIVRPLVGHLIDLAVAAVNKARSK